MQVTELKNDELIFEAKIVIPVAKVDNEVQKELTVLSKKVKIDGFRVGKVPAKVVEKKYKTSVRSDVVQREISHAIQHITKDHNLKILGDPKLENLHNIENEDLEFILKLELLPNINLPDFKQILITRPKLIVGEEEVNKQVDKLLTKAKTYNIENAGEAEKGQQVTIDAIGYVDGEPFEGGKVTDYKLVLGSKVFIDNFEEQLIGSKAGTEVEVNVTFPNDYNMPQVAGKAAKFIVQVKSVHSAPEVVADDTFAKKFNRDTLEALRNDISKQIEEEAKESIITIMKMSLFDQLEKILTFNVPQSLVTQEINILKSQVDNTKESNTWLKNKSEVEINEYYNKLALRRVRIGLILAEYIKVKELYISQEDIKNAIMTHASSFPGQEVMILDLYKKNPKAVERLRGPLLEEKAVQEIFDHEVILTEKDYTRKEFEEFLSKQEERIEEQGI